MSSDNNMIMDTKEINARRRAALFNIKAKNSGSNDYFGRDVKKERELEIERQKIREVLQKKLGIKEVDKILLTPGNRK
jgi:hypothetical protein